MKTVKEIFSDALGYGDEAEILVYNRLHMLAIVQFSGSAPCELVKFSDIEGGFIHPSADLSERELVPFTVLQGTAEQLNAIFNVLITAPVYVIKSVSGRKKWVRWRNLDSSDLLIF